MARRLLLLAALFVGACNLIAGPGDLDSGNVHDGGQDAALPDGDGEVFDERLPGSLTGIVAEFGVLSDRLCDLDGNGSLDNSIADLGEAHADLFAMAMTTLIRGRMQQGRRLLVHMPHVDDLQAPSSEEAMLLILQNTDTDVPAYPEDDLSGTEAFWAHPRDLDSCGEPVHVFDNARLDDGALLGGPGSFAVDLGTGVLTFRGVQLGGVVAPLGATAEITACSYATIQGVGSLGREPGVASSLLEILLLGGATLGLPTVPGLAPDVDLDEDGLERLLLDDDDHLSSCIDGDGTVIDGPDCWQDERIADAFSLSLSMSAVSAGLVGPRPGWQFEVSGECASFPQSPSLWGECAAQSCERWASRECTPTCGGAGIERCEWDCSGWSACRPIASTAEGFTACGDVELEGPGALCGGEPSTVRLSDGLNQRRALGLARRISVARGPVTIQATARVSPGETLLPGDGWAIVAYVDAGDILLGTDWFLYGAAQWRQGYTFQWGFSSIDAGDERDQVDLVALPVDPTNISGSMIGSTRRSEVHPPLDSTNPAPVEQTLRLVIQPDLTETEENELNVAGQIMTGTDTVALDLSCRGDGCPTLVQEGQLLQIGIISATEENDAVIDVVAPDGLQVDVQGVCP